MFFETCGAAVWLEEQWGTERLFLEPGKEPKLPSPLCGFRKQNSREPNHPSRLPQASEGNRNTQLWLILKRLDPSE